MILVYSFRNWNNGYVMKIYEAESINAKGFFNHLISVAVLSKKEPHVRYFQESCSNTPFFRSFSQKLVAVFRAIKGYEAGSSETRFFKFSEDEWCPWISHIFSFLKQTSHANYGWIKLSWSQKGRQAGCVTLSQQEHNEVPCYNQKPSSKAEHSFSYKPQLDRVSIKESINIKITICMLRYVEWEIEFYLEQKPW